MHQIHKLKWFSSCLAVVFAQSIEARCRVENEDVVGAAPTGDAPTTSEWSTIKLPTKVCLILETWQYIETFTSHALLQQQLSDQQFYCLLNCLILEVSLYSLWIYELWTKWTPMSAVPKKAVKLNHSFTHFQESCRWFILCWGFAMLGFAHMIQSYETEATCDCPSASDATLNAWNKFG